MRYSSNYDDRGYSNFQALQLQGKTVEVYFGGILLENVETCDEENGFAVKAKLDEYGNIHVINCDNYEIKHRLPNGKIVSSGSAGQIAREFVRGRITTRIINR